MERESINDEGNEKESVLSANPAAQWWDLGEKVCRTTLRERGMGDRWLFFLPSFLRRPDFWGHLLLALRFLAPRFSTSNNRWRRVFGSFTGAAGPFVHPFFHFLALPALPV